jgi:hypothetical protein
MPLIRAALAATRPRGAGMPPREQNCRRKNTRDNVVRVQDGPVAPAVAVPIGSSGSRAGAGRPVLGTQMVATQKCQIVVLQQTLVSPSVSCVRPRDLCMVRKW